MQFFLQSAFACFERYCSCLRKNKVLSELCWGDPTAWTPLQQLGSEKRQFWLPAVSAESHPIMSCHTMRWLRSALACSFMGASSLSSASPSSSPKHNTSVSVTVVIRTICSSSVPSLTHPEVDIAFSATHHQHGFISFLSWDVCCLVTRCFSSTDGWRYMTWKQRDNSQIDWIPLRQSLQQMEKIYSEAKVRNRIFEPEYSLFPQLRCFCQWLNCLWLWAVL